MTFLSLINKNRPIEIYKSTTLHRTYGISVLLFLFSIFAVYLCITVCMYFVSGNYGFSALHFPALQLLFLKGFLALRFIRALQFLCNLFPVITVSLHFSFPALQLLCLKGYLALRFLRALRFYCSSFLVFSDFSVLRFLGFTVYLSYSFSA